MNKSIYQKRQAQGASRTTELVDHLLLKSNHFASSSKASGYKKMLG
jgi:hypothetical protein